MCAIPQVMFSIGLEKTERNHGFCVAELSWCHWWRVWLQVTHHRRSGHHHRHSYGKCAIGLTVTPLTSICLLLRRMNTEQTWANKDFNVVLYCLPLCFRCLGWSLACSCAVPSGSLGRWCDTHHHIVKSLLMLHDVIPWVTWLSTANRNTACSRGITYARLGTDISGYQL